MTQDPRALARDMQLLDPAGDEALELARVALCMTETRPYRLEAALADVLNVWAGRVVAHAAKGGPRLTDRVEAEAEARLWVIEQLREFKPAEEGGSVAVFLRARLTWFRSRVRRGEASNAQSQTSYTVNSAAGKAREEFLSRAQRDPSSAELKDAVQAMLLEQNKAKLLATKEFETEEDLEKAARARMSKDGVTAALERFDEIRIESQAPVPLQVLEPREEDPRPHWGVTLPVIEETPFGALDEEEEYERLLSVALGDSLWARSAFSARAGERPSGAEGQPDDTTLRGFAEQESRSIAEIKNVLVSARSRITAPHAQWAHLSPSLVVEEN